MNKVLSYTFIILLVLALILQLATPAKYRSMSERRLLKNIPELTLESYLDGSFMEKFEAYALDQFPFRDSFRGLKSYMELYAFRKSDINGIYLLDDHLLKRDDVYRPESVERFADYIKAVTDTFNDANTVYYSIIPDKNFFVDQSVIDYNHLLKNVQEDLSSLTYIALTDLLTLDDFYRTDTHWKQENLEAVLDLFKNEMKLHPDNDFEDYTQAHYHDFKGVYLDQSALIRDPETLTYLIHPDIEQWTIKNYNDPNRKANLYEVDLLEGMDAYDVFLGGATPLVEILNPNAKSDRELVMFRDSFASSLAPLLIDSYSKVTLVDTRYMPISILDQFVQFTDQDVLFLYNTAVINNSQMLR